MLRKAYNSTKKFPAGMHDESILAGNSYYQVYGLPLSFVPKIAGSLLFLFVLVHYGISLCYQVEQIDVTVDRCHDSADACSYSVRLVDDTVSVFEVFVE